MSRDAHLLRLVRLTAACCLLAPAAAIAQPRHDICTDIGGTLGGGISSFSAAGDWLVAAHEEQGVRWGFVYVYLTPPGDDLDGYRWFIGHKGEVARSVGAMPVFTFYQLLHLGQEAGLGGSEPEIVAQVLGRNDLMRVYFDNFVLVLEAVGALDPPALVHVEPDSWGFMMWAMGVEGNDDPTSIPVQVAASGHPDLADLPDHAGGLGQALAALRDLHAPEVRLGWHASNFRVGTRPEVVVGFFSQMGSWDVLVGEHPHNEADESRWWEPWDADRVEANLSWLVAVTAGAAIPILLWQLPIGTTDWHLLEPDGADLLERYARAGVVGLMFEHLGSGDPDGFRASGELGTAPPADSVAGGTAADLRRRLAAYGGSPVGWPEGSPCGVGGASDGDADADADEDADFDLSPTDADWDLSPTDTDSDRADGGAGNGDGAGGCSCGVAGLRRRPAASALIRALRASVSRAPAS